MPVQLQIPTIGTLLTLTEPWDFRLYFESRNFKMLTALTGHEFGWGDGEGEWDDRRGRWQPAVIVGVTFNGYKVGWDTFGIPQDDKSKDEMEMSRTWREHQPMSYIDVCLPINTMLTVDRIYIRKGVDAYNSLTFWLKKPAKLPKVKKGEPPVIPSEEYDFLQRVGGNRFWAKLPDVNNIVCEMT